MRNTKLLAAFFLFSVLTLLFASPDSYLYDLWLREDSAWFFVNGKAWMNGMEPYVDFADSKGPLLFLIYGIGYLLSPYNYLGIFWLSCIVYTICFFLTYKSARIFIDHRHALLATFLMALAYFFPAIHWEVRAEDFCLPFVLLSFYAFLALFYKQKELPADRQINRYAFFFGISLGATLMIKFSVTAIIGIFPLMGIIYVIREKRLTPQTIGYGLAGLAVPTLPFLLYFLIKGTTSAFFTEYFSNTLSTVSKNQGGLQTNIFEIMYLFRNSTRLLLLLSGIFGCIYISRRLSKWRYSILIGFLWFVLLGTKHTFLTMFNHYFFPSLVFQLFTIIFLIDFFLQGKTVTRLRVVATAALVCLFIAPWSLFRFTGGKALSADLFAYDSEYRQEYYTVAYLMSQVPNPTYTNWAQRIEMGIGMPVNALPGIKYNTQQSGATKEMCESMKTDITEKKPDFVVLRLVEEFPERSAYLKQLGYHECYFFTNVIWNEKCCLLTRHNVKMPPPSFKVTPTDVLFKRKIF